MQKKQQRETPSAASKRSVFMRMMVIVAIVLIVSLVVTKGLIESDLLRPPYPWAGKKIAWFMRSQEHAYNFDEVKNDVIYRSSNPDVHFLKYLQKEYGITTVVSLAGPQDWFEDAKAMGLNVHKYRWGTSQLPAADELEQVQALLDQADADHPVLIHCSAGADRTGYAIALYRVQTEEWPLADAVNEMRAYWHFPETKEKLHRQIENYLQPPVETATAEVPTDLPIIK